MTEEEEEEVEEEEEEGDVVDVGVVKYIDICNSEPSIGSLDDFQGPNEDATEATS